MVQLLQKVDAPIGIFILLNCFRRLSVMLVWFKKVSTKCVIFRQKSLIETYAGTTVYIEQSIPYPQDGKQGWWSGGFGLWIGILVASGYSVVPVPSALWKRRFKLYWRSL